MLRKKIDYIDIIIGSVLIAISTCALLPFLYVVSLSFTDPDFYEPFRVSLIPKRFSLDTYVYVLKSGEFINALKSTVLITLVGTILNLIITFTFAYGLTKKNVPFRGVLLFVVILSLLFDPGLIPKFILIRDLGLMNSYWAVILPVLTNSWSVIIAKSFLQNIPDELEEAAIIDGCSQIGTFVRIVLPLSTASIATLTLFFAVGHWNVYIKPMMYLTDPIKRTMQVYLRSLLMVGGGGGESLEQFDDQNIPAETMRMATVVLSILPILIVYPFVQRYFIKGVMIGSVKG